MNHALRPNEPAPSPFAPLPARSRRARRRPGGKFAQRFTLLENLEPRTLLTASLAGQVFNDADFDRVKDAGEAGIPDVVVFLDSDDDGVLDAGEMSMMTDASGNYLFGGLAAGFVAVRQVLPAGLFRTLPSNDSYSGTLTADQVVTDLDFGNVAVSAILGSIAGQVFNDGDGDGAKDDGETGVAGVTVFLDADNDGQLDAGETSAMTDASGNYLFNDLMPGAYTVREVVPPNTTRTLPTSGTYSVTLGLNQDVTGRDFGNAANSAFPGTIAGLVFNDVNGNGTRDTDDTGMPDVVVFLDADNDGQLDAGETSVMTNAMGNYVFEGVVPGSYTVRQVQPAGTLRTLPGGGSYSVTVGLSQNVTGRDFGNAAANAILGQVYNDADRDGTRDAGEQGRAGVTVFFDVNNNGIADAAEPMATTNAQGNYVLVVSAPAEGIVRQVLNDGVLPSAPVGNAHAVTVPAGQNIRNRDFATYRIAGTDSASISGHLFIDYNGNGVQDPGDNGASGITIFAKQNGVVLASITTDSLGNYAFTGVPVGTYSIGQVLPDGVTQTVPALGDVNVTITNDTQTAYANFADQLIGPDLIIALDSVKFGRIETPTLLTPGDKISLKFTVTNQGNRSSKGKIAINVIGSLTPTFNAQTDRFLGQLFNKSANISSGKSKTYTVNVTIPAGLAPGQYFLSGQSVDLTGIGETNYNNNTDTAQTPTSVTLQFGTFQDHNNKKLFFVTPNGAVGATLAISGGGSGQLFPLFDGSYNLQLTGTTEKTKVTITTDKNSLGPLLLNSIQSPTGLSGIVAKTTDVQGNITILGGGLGTLNLRNISLGNTFSFAGPLGTFTAGSVFGLNLNVGAEGSRQSIKSIKALSWNGGVIEAASIESMSITGQRESNDRPAIAGDLSASLRLTGVDPKKPTLKALTVAGALNGTEIDSAGSIGAVKAAAMVDTSIYAGVTMKSQPGLPDLTTDFGGSSIYIDSVTVTGLVKDAPSFIRSRIAAPHVDTVKLAIVDTAAAGTSADSLFGIAGLIIDLLNYIEPDGTKINLGKLTIATDPRLDVYPDGKFSVVVAAAPAGG